MLGIRSPIKSTKTERAGPSVVRRSIGEIEARTSPQPETQTNPVEVKKVGLSQTTLKNKPGNKAKVRTEAKVISPKKTPTYRTKIAEAKACLLKAKLQLNNSRTSRANIKSDVLYAVECLYALVKEAERETTRTSCSVEELEQGNRKEIPPPAFRKTRNVEKT